MFSVETFFAFGVISFLSFCLFAISTSKRLFTLLCRFCTLFRIPLSYFRMILPILLKFFSIFIIKST